MLQQMSRGRLPCSPSDLGLSQTPGVHVFPAENH